MDEFAVGLFRHNLWANLRLLDVCADLPEDQLSAAGPGTYGPVEDTLLHMFAAEERYVGELSKQYPGERLAEGQPFPGVPALRERALSSGQALVDQARRMEADSMVSGTYRGQPYELRANVLFIQAINHATEHRAHIVSTLTPLGVDAPGLDALSYVRSGAAV